MKEINHEYYVSLEIAKLLSEAGFDWKQYSFYNSKGILINGTFGANWNDKIWHIDGSKVSAPTLNVTQRWLRELKKTHIEVSPSSDMNAYIYNILLSWDKFWLGSPTSYDTYEEAQEAGIKKALEICLEKGK